MARAERIVDGACAADETVSTATVSQGHLPDPLPLWQDAGRLPDGRQREIAMRLVATTLLLLAAGTVAASAAGFDCRPYYASRTCPEIVICDTPQISAQDDQMSQVYRLLMNRLPASRAVRLRDDQRAWLDQRNGCGCDANCVLNAYDRRLNELDRY
ncbi:lysozyme inhibitor LprI family protein [Prosthecodimorpha staleyi]|uniref:DUF1311 domain-containing protein n=1 Tax=Prosthecodimorpha staleyi TaxID=2840188 RepID=A0A947CZ69_9HYPH|nr:lysozyme inhibitor LprI family protein [Prosthecodimorpha staleyi]MBT9287830.1 DUF1311 domain-containing protein [Prosthecodimorpha staleyi]